MDPASKAAIEEELRAALEASGHRFTAQRAAVYSYLRRVESHPTADEIFTNVRDDIPDISLATVYKALEAFVSAGAARKLQFGDGPARYDGRTDDHHHMRCLACGGVHDVEAEVDHRLKGGLLSRNGFEVIGYRLELLGYCPACKN
jgi:Fur family peroxide stress response transcriptional regulator